MRGVIIDINACFGFEPERKVDVSLSQLLGLMDRFNIDKALAYSLKAVYYDFQEGNEETLRVAQREPSIIPVAVVNPQQFPHFLKATKEIKEAGFKAIRLFPHLHHYPYDFSPLEYIFQEALQAELPVLIHCRSQGSATLMGRWAERFAIPFILCEVGYDNLAEVLYVAIKNSNIYIDTSYLDGFGNIEIAREYLGADRLLFGSGMPYRNPYPAMETVRRSFLSLEEKEKIMGTNARRLFLWR